MDFYVLYIHVCFIKICIAVLLEKLDNKVIKDRTKQSADSLSV